MFAGVADVVAVGIGLVGIEGVDAVVYVIADAVLVLVGALIATIADMDTTASWIAGVRGTRIAIIAIDRIPCLTSSIFSASLGSAGVMVIAIRRGLTGKASFDWRIDAACFFVTRVTGTRISVVALGGIPALANSVDALFLAVASVAIVAIGLGFTGFAAFD